MDQRLYAIGRAFGLFNKPVIKIGRKARKKVRAYLAAEENSDVCSFLMGPMWQNTGIVTPEEYAYAKRMSWVHLQTKLQALMALIRIMGSEAGAESAIQQVLDERAARRCIEFVPAEHYESAI